MKLEELNQVHVEKLANSFGVANAQSVVRDDRAARALGTPDNDRTQTDLGKVEY